MDEHEIDVFWSEEDQEYVATCGPYLSWLDDSPISALNGLRRLLEEEAPQPAERPKPFHDDWTFWAGGLILSVGLLALGRYLSKTP